MEQKLIEKKVMQYQMLDQKIKQMREQVKTADEQLVEMVGTIRNLDDVSQIEDKQEILVPISNGIFAKAHIKKDTQFLVNIGSSVVIDRSVEQTKSLIENQKDDLKEMRNTMAEKLNTYIKKAADIERELKDVL